VTTLRLDIHSKDEQLSAYCSENQQLTQQNTEHKQLIAKLENDLTKYVTYRHGHTATGSAETETATQSPNAGGDDDDDDDGTSEHEQAANENEPLLYRILNVGHDGDGDEERKVKEESMTMSITIDDGAQKTDDAVAVGDNDRDDGNSAFSIICEQRNRFRIKSETLEQSKLKLEAHLERIASDNTQLKQENVELYAKIKYLENYNSVKKSHKELQQQQQQQQQQQKQRRSAVPSGSGVKHSDITLMKYENLYEEQMNPFAQFKRRETENRINSLEWTEWIAYIVGSTVLSKRLFRLLTVFYAIALHLLIFFTILHEYRSHGVFDSHLHCNEQPPAIQLDIPPNLAVDVGHMHG